MTGEPSLDCRVDQRRRKLFGNPDWNGLDYLDVADDQQSLCVHFFGGIPKDIGPDNVRIEGGARISGIKAVAVRIDPSRDEELDDCLRITLDRPGDFSTYRLCLVGVPGMDPRFSCLEFSFKTNCPSDLDCGAAPACPPPRRGAPDINYLAKDYASFRQLIYDRLALTAPDWRERHVPDIGVTLVELLAYAADYLSYYQDAVATEAYLGTARQRISVRRHLRLIDYALHEGCNARAFVAIGTDADLPVLTSDDFFFITGFPNIRSDRGFVDAASLPDPAEQPVAVFEPIGPGPYTFLAARSSIAFHDWGDAECCLPAGATRATLVDHREESDPEAKSRLDLKRDDFLIFEEQKGPLTGNPADADPAHRHVVRLTKVTKVHDALLETLALDIEWAAEDALPFPLCISARRAPPDCDPVRDVSVARGNVVLVDHGRRVDETLPAAPGCEVAVACACEGSVIEVRSEGLAYAPPLSQGPLTFAEPVRPAASAAALFARDPRCALPAVALADRAGPWQARRDLLGSDGDARDFVAEMDDEGIAHLRFGDGVHGRRPDIGTEPRARYRVGNGSAGNVGRDAIAYLVLRSGKIKGPALTVRNPLPARGGTDAEPVAEARLFAPGLIQARRERAITAEDYAELAARNARLQGAVAKLCWSGCWYEAQVAIDPLASRDEPALPGEVAGALQRYRRIGHDLAVEAGRRVPLRLVLHVCVLPHFDRAHVKAAVLETLGNQRLASGALGFFHPDNWRFGQSVSLSRIVAAVMGIDGVETVAVVALHRLNEADDGAALAAGRLVMRRGEIAKLDNDPNFPENGRIELDMGGGR